MNQKFGGGRRPTGTPSLAWSSVVVVVSLLAGASVVHNLYKPDLVRALSLSLSLSPARTHTHTHSRSVISRSVIPSCWSITKKEYMQFRFCIWPWRIAREVFDKMFGLPALLLCLSLIQNNIRPLINPIHFVQTLPPVDGLNGSKEGKQPEKEWNGSLLPPSFSALPKFNCFCF